MDKPMSLKTISLIVIKDLFQDGGKWSLSRITSGITIVAVVAWVSFLVLKTHTLPDLDGPALFSGSGAAHYGLGKWFGKKADDPSPTGT